MDGQLRFYEKRDQDFEKSQGQVTKISGAILVATAIVAFLAGADSARKSIWTTLAAVLPALATMFVAYSALYSFERIAKLYRDAARQLRLAKVDAPDIVAQPPTSAAVAAYVSTVEEIFQRELGQWGQLPSKTRRSASADPPS
jgi:hypothetical protein